MLYSKAVSTHSRLLPIDMVIVRNALSEGAIVMKKVQMGEKIDLDEFRRIHSSRWRLTDFGVLQARNTGKWLNEHFPNHFNAYMTGEYVRSIETAVNLGIPNASWQPSFYLRPREFGDFSIFNGLKLSDEEYQRQLNERNRDTFYWTPPNGESIAHLNLRVERVMNWIRNHVQDDGACIIVTNKDIMETIRIRLENISQAEFNQRINHCPQDEQLNYCSVLHYSRRNPKTGEIVPRYSWFRVVTPWMGKQFAKEGFKEIYQKFYTNEDLLAEVSNVPKLFE